MRFLKIILVTASIAGGAGLFAACGGAGEPQSTAIPSAIAPAAAQPEVDPTKGGAQDATPTPVPTAKATPAALLEPTSDVPTVPPQTATATPAGPPPSTKPTPTRPPTIAPADTPVPTATQAPTATPAPTCSHSDQSLNGGASRVTVELTGNSIGRFRVREQFARVSLPNDAVGETREVSGSLVFDGSGAVVAGQSKITVGLLSLQSDEDDRDEFLRTNSLQSEKFPSAELVVRETPGMPWPIPCQGEALFQIAGDMTVHGVTVPMTWDAAVQFRPDGVKGLMTINFPFSTFDMKKPKRLFLLSVDDDIRLELQFDAPITASP